MTSANELYAPLGLREDAGKRHWRFGLVPALVITGGITAGLAGWIALVDDPLGGEPRARVVLPPLTPPPAPAAQAASVLEPVRAEASAPPAPEGRSTITIITPGGPGQGMQTRVVEVPDGRPPSLRPAPDPRLVDKVRHGLLPRIGTDGTRPWRAYARPAASGARRDGPRVAILVGGLGVAANATNEAVARLPGEVTLAFSPYGANLQTQVNRARADGHEVLLQVPMEPFDFPSNDPGPQTLLTSLSADQNTDRLHWALSRFSGYIGVTNFMGGRFAADAAAFRPILQELRARGLVFADDGSSPRTLGPQIAAEIGLGHARGAATIDAVPTAEKIDEALAALEDEAQRSGQALGIASAVPITVERLVRWSRSLDRRGITLVPVSAIITGERAD
jgi:polysaccharide deacetylase 2 family uncharacterized protein YibQ